MVKADYTELQFQWSEWDVTAMTTGAFLPAVSITPAFLGTYTAFTFPNPLKTAGTTITDFPVNPVTFAEETEPYTRMAGDVGDLVYYSNFAGIYKETAAYLVPYAIISDEYQIFRDRFTAFETAKTAYNALKATYDAAIDYQTLKSSDPLRSALQAPTELPTRPCPPDVPTGYAGIDLQTAPSVAFASWTTTQKGANYATFNSGSQVAAVADTLRSGFLQISTNTASITTTETANVGHVFGRMGQGARTMPSYALNGATVTNTAFQWKSSEANAHVLSFSLLPSSASDAGLSATKKIEITAQVLQFVALTDLQIPAQPAAATAPKAAGSMMGAAMTATAGAGLIAMTLF